jgi:hypothetical protein
VRRSRRSSLAIVFALVIVAACALLLFRHAHQGRLVFPGDDPTGAARLQLPRVEANAPVSVGSVVLCAKGTATPATIVRVEPLDGEHLVATAFATRPNPNLTRSGRQLLLAQPKPLADAGFDTAARNVDVCRPPSPDSEGQPTATSEVGVTFERTPGSSFGSDTGYRVYYRFGGGGVKSLDVHYGLTLCAAACPAKSG